MRKETIWIAPMNRWVETGHVFGTSLYERRVLWFENIVAVLSEFENKLLAKHARMKYGNKRNGLTRKIKYLRHVILAGAYGELLAARNCVAAEAADRRAQFVKDLVQSSNYLCYEAAADLRAVTIKHIEAIQRHFGPDVARKGRHRTL